MSTVRPATPDDGPFLWDMLAAALNWRPGPAAISGDEIMARPELNHYLAGWPRDDDVGFVVEDGAPIGAAWWRFFHPKTIWGTDSSMPAPLKFRWA